MPASPLSGLRLAGHLDVVQTSLDVVGSSLNTDVTYNLVTFVRDTSIVSQGYVYYIQVDYELNSLITYDGSETTNALDDAYAFAGFSVKDTDALAPILHLPTISGVNVIAGSIAALDPVSLLLRTFPVNLTIAMNNQGVMSASILISGADAIANVVDNSLLAQVAYWPINGAVPPTLNADTADNLDQPMSAGELTTHFSTELSTILAYYNGTNLITSWELTFDAIVSSTTNQLSDYARNVSNPGSAAVFAADVKVVAATPFSYQIDIVDATGATINIIPASNIYGVANNKL